MLYSRISLEFLIRALAAGYKVDVIPEVLMLYRRTKQSRSMGQDYILWPSEQPKVNRHLVAARTAAHVTGAAAGVVSTSPFAA